MTESNANPGFGCTLSVGDGGVGAGVKASVTKGSTNSQIIFSAKKAGTSANGKTVVAVASGNNTALSVAVTKTSIAITLETDGSGASVSTVNDVIAKLYANDTFKEYFDATDGVGDGTGILAAFTSSPLAGGTLGAEVFTPIAEITGIPGVGVTSRTSEVTHMTSPEGFAEHIATGVKEQKAITIPINFVADDLTQRDLIETKLSNGSKNNFRIAFTDDSQTLLTFTALVTDSDISHDRDSHAQGTISLLPSGVPTWSEV